MDAKRPGGGGGVGSVQTPTDKGEGVKNWQNLADVFYGWPLTVWGLINVNGFNSCYSFELITFSNRMSKTQDPGFKLNWMNLRDAESGKVLWQGDEDL